VPSAVITVAVIPPVPAAMFSRMCWNWAAISSETGASLIAVNASVLKAAGLGSGVPDGMAVSDGAPLVVGEPLGWQPTRSATTTAAVPNRLTSFRGIIRVLQEPGRTKTRKS
jgi:hypothetical protein